MIRLGNFPIFSVWFNMTCGCYEAGLRQRSPDLKMQRMAFPHATMCMYTYTLPEECKLCLSVWLPSIHLFTMFSLSKQAGRRAGRRAGSQAGREPLAMYACMRRGSGVPEIAVTENRKKTECHPKPGYRGREKWWGCSPSCFTWDAHTEACTEDSRRTAAQKILIKPDWCSAY